MRKSRQFLVKAYGALGWLALAVAVMGSGPCYNDQCSRFDQTWCEGNLLVSCEQVDDSPSAYDYVRTDCRAQGLVCTGAAEGQADGGITDEEPACTPGCEVDCDCSEAERCDEGRCLPGGQRDRCCGPECAS